MITGIIVALSEELNTLKTLPNALWEPSLQRGKFVFLTDEVLLTYSGAGSENARKAAELLVSKGATKLMSWGCAAALSPDLKMGDLVLADSLMDENGDEVSVHPIWHQHAKTVLSSQITAYKGALIASNSIVSTAQAKENLHAKTGAIALDMESYAIAKVAQHYAIPFLAIRAIADPASMDLPAAVENALNENGEVAITRIIKSLVLNPKELPHLIQIGQYFQIAKKTLANVAKALPEVIVFKAN